MSNKINSVIKLRSDTISNWLSNSNIILQDSELSIIKYPDNTVNLKLGNGSSYANTPLLKFNTLTTNYISDGISTYTFPSTGGVLTPLLTLFSNIQVIKPVSEKYLHIRLVGSLNKDFSNPIISIDSKVDFNKLTVLSVSKSDTVWDNVTGTGLGVEYNNRPVKIDLLENIISSEVTLDYNTIIYIKYTWYYEENNVEHLSDYYSITIPSNTEVGANSQDAIGRVEFSEALSSKADLIYINSKLDEKLDINEADNLYAPKSVVGTINNLIINVNNKVDKISGKGLSTNDFTNSEKEKLNNIESNAEVNIIESISINETTATINNKVASLNIDSLISDSNGKVYGKVSGVKKELAYSTDINTKLNNLKYSMYSTLQVIKPYSNEYSYIKLIASKDQDFETELFSIDSRFQYNLIKGYSTNNGNVIWININENGIGVEYNNLPISINLLSSLMESDFNIDTDNTLYIRYYWYTLDGNNEIKSDNYSAVLPSNTEVGANSQDVVSKDDLLKLRGRVVLVSQSASRDSSTAVSNFRCYPDKYNIINESYLVSDNILLDSYEFGNIYKIKLNIGSVDSYINFIYESGGSKVEIPELNPVTKYLFKANKSYLLTINCGHINVVEDDTYIVESNDIGKKLQMLSELSLIDDSVDSVTEYVSSLNNIFKS